MAAFRLSVKVPWQVDDIGGSIRLWFTAFPAVFDLSVTTNELLQILLASTLDGYGFFKPTETSSPHMAFIENIERVRDCVRDPRVVGLGFEVVAAEGVLKWHPEQEEAEICFQWELEED